MQVKNLPQHQREAEKLIRKAAEKEEKEAVAALHDEVTNVTGEKSNKEDAVRVKEIETVVFIPTTEGSKLKKILQEKDDNLCRIAGSPTVRFVEKGGPTILDQVGRNNPWAGDWFCP